MEQEHLEFFQALISGPGHSEAPCGSPLSPGARESEGSAVCDNTS